MITFAVDFETYYDKECNIKTLGLEDYINHSKFDAYLVSVVGDNGFEFVGHPKKFNWYVLEGNRVVSHNAMFDRSIYIAGACNGHWPDVRIFEWLCTADLCSSFGIARSLKNAVSKVFGLKISKKTRNTMKGKTWEKMTPKFREEVKTYAREDAELCLRLWFELTKDGLP